MPAMAQLMVHGAEPSEASAAPAFADDGSDYLWGGEGVLRPRSLAPDFFAREKLCNRLVAFDSV